MNKNKLILTFTFVFLAMAGVFLLPKNLVLAQAAAPARLDLNINGQVYSISHKLAQSWFGNETVEQNNILSLPEPPLQEALLTALGQTPVIQNQPPVYHYKLNEIYSYIKDIASEADQPAVAPILQIENNRVATFTPPQIGLTLDVYKNSLNVLTALELGKNSLDLFAYRQETNEVLGDTNNLGIKELIGQGVSSFKGSPKNRRFNIAVGVEKMKGILIAPGATFSFNQYLGPVDGEHGFLPELVIKGNNTIPEFGGGLCQVSSTTFRGAMDAGLPILERRNHAYAVQYYSPQGTDATIYPGSVDLKFKNNTPGTILIWPYEKDTNTLVFDFYGTKDGRKVTLEKPVVYDRLPDGSMKATWTRLVTNNGVTTTDTFKSSYASPALFHHDTVFVSATGTPIGGLQTAAKTQ